MGREKKISLKTAAVLLAGAVLVLCGIAFSAHALHRSGIFVDDTRYWKEISEISVKYGVDPQLVRAVVFQESRFDRRAVGSKGEVGLMQIHLDGAAADWARLHKQPVPTHASLMAAELNLEIGVWYLARALKNWEKYKGQIALALVQYNAGAARANRWKPDTCGGEVISRIKIPSTRDYVVKITERYRKYSEEKK